MITVDLVKAAKHAADLAAYMRRVANGENDFAAGAWNALSEIRRIGDDLTAELDERHRLNLAAQIGSAVGAAATHAWTATASDLICERCSCHAMPFMLRHGQTPPCGEPCPTGWDDRPGHQLTAVYDDDAYTAAGKTKCVHCKTVYASTVEVEPSASREGVAR